MIFKIHYTFIFGILLLVSCLPSKPDTLPTVAENPSVAVVKEDHIDFFLEHYERFFQTNFNVSECPGAAVVIVKDSTVIYKKGFGVKKLGTSDSVDVHSVFRIASLSKGVTSLLAGNLVDKNELTWDQPVQPIVPTFTLKDKSHAQRVTVGHLLSHSSGLYKYANTKLIHKGLPLNQIITGFKYQNVVAKEGTTYAYQNAAFSIVEKVMEQKTNRNFSTLLKERLFVPLGMNNASSSYHAMLENENVALPHRWSNSSNKYYLTKLHKNYYNVIAAGGINASITDMGQYLKALLGYRKDVISSESLSEIFEPVVPTPGTNSYINLWEGVTGSYYAKGWRVLDYRGRRILYHGGNVNQYKGQLMVDPENKIAICVLFNGPNTFNGPVIPTFLNYYEFFKDFQQVLK